jgi:mannose/cellobiose epimerase-like protein (N-acyl-D-glucosamine 2-epimerase family)
MNEEDLRDCFAMFALAGAVMAGKERTAQDIWEIADEMMEARKPKEESGIAAIKTRARKRA